MELGQKSPAFPAQLQEVLPLPLPVGSAEAIIRVEGGSTAPSASSFLLPLPSTAVDTKGPLLDTSYKMNSISEFPLKAA